MLHPALICCFINPWSLIVSPMIFFDGTFRRRQTGRRNTSNGAATMRRSFALGRSGEMRWFKHQNPIRKAPKVWIQLFCASAYIYNIYIYIIHLYTYLCRYVCVQIDIIDPLYCVVFSSPVPSLFSQRIHRRRHSSATPKASERTASVRT